MKHQGEPQKVDLTGKTVVITGATAGIGKETAKNLAGMGARVVLAARSEAKSLKTIKEIRHDLGPGPGSLEYRPLNLADLDSVRTFGSTLDGLDAIDVLINNAGVAHETGTTEQGIERIFGINYLSHFLLTKELMPALLRAEGRIINVSSMGHTSARREHFDMPYRGDCSQMSPQQRYGRSKAAQILFTRALQRRLDRRGADCTSSCLHPGGVRTNIFDTYGLAPRAVILLLWPFMVDPAEGAWTSVYLATTDRPEETAGRYFYYGLFRKGIYEKPGNEIVNDEELQERLWAVSEDLVGESFSV